MTELYAQILLTMNKFIMNCIASVAASLLSLFAMTSRVQAQNIGKELSLDIIWKSAFTSSCDTSYQIFVSGDAEGPRYGLQSFEFQDDRHLVGIVCLLGEDVDSHPPPPRATRSDTTARSIGNLSTIQNPDSALIIVGQTVEEIGSCFGYSEQPDSSSCITKVPIGEWVLIQGDFRVGQEIWVMAIQESVNLGEIYRVVLKD